MAALLLAAGCAAPARTTSESVSGSEMRRNEAPPRSQRPLPAPLDMPSDFAAAVENGTRTLDGRPGPRYWTNTADYTLEARLLPEEKRLEGRARIVYQNNSPDTLATLHLELAQNLHAASAVRGEPVEITGGVELRRVAVGGRALSDTALHRPTYRVQGTQFVIAPEAPVLPGQSVTLAIEYGFTIPQQGASGRMGYSPEENPDLFFVAYWFPTMSVYDDVAGWYTDPFRGRAEFYDDYGSYDLTLDVPAGWLVQSTGALQNPGEVLRPSVAERMRRAHQSDTPLMVLEAGDDGTRQDRARLRYHYTAENVRDAAFSATTNANWEAARTSVGDRDDDGQENFTEINTIWRDAAPRWSEVTRYQQHAITFLSGYTGLPYPWPHMTAVEGEGIIGGGMEFPMMTLIGPYTARGDSALYNVTAHELAHMWIPMQVSTNERRRSWIDEGTTSFSENQARQDFYPGAPSPDVLEQESYLNVARADLEGEIMRWSDFQYTGIAFGTASYSKPATLLVALRGLLGNATFKETLVEFINDWRFKHPYPQDFFNAFEREAGRDLDWFWHSFYYETWTLDQAVAGVQLSDGGVRITLFDLGRAPMPVDLTLTLAGGEQITRRVPVDTWLEGRREVVVNIPTSAPVRRVEIDAPRNFPDIDRANNVWMSAGGAAASAR